MSDPVSNVRPRRVRSTGTRGLTLRTTLALALASALILTACVVAGCSSSAARPAGLVISGPGLQTGKPPWRPEYAHLRERVRAIKLPAVGKEHFHIHAMLHIYVNGLLQPVPALVGIDPPKHFITSLHTHDSTGIIHMETEHRYAFTLGDFFAVWGVKLGPDQVGGLTGLGGDKLHFYVNGRPLTNPAAYVLHRRDSIVIGYGAPGSFPRSPSTFLLKEVEEGKGGLGCSSGGKTKKKTSCVAQFLGKSPGATGKRSGAGKGGSGES
jgi:hypothetical protein